MKMILRTNSRIDEGATKLAITTINNEERLLANYMTSCCWTNGLVVSLNYEFRTRSCNDNRELSLCWTRSWRFNQKRK
jgi:hypothetical protein